MAIAEMETLTGYEMPLIKMGSVVTFYPTGLPGGATDVGFVYKVNARNVYLWSSSKGRRTAVPHITDPRLKLNPEQREMGAWDFTEDQKAMWQEIQELREGLVAARQEIGKVVAQLVRRKSTESSE